VRKFLSKVAGLRASASARITVALATAFGASVANAEVPAIVTTTLDASAIDVTSVAQGVLVVILTIATFKWIRRALQG
jgi:hypothetical protein